MNFQISLPSLPRFKNKSLNFIFWHFNFQISLPSLLLFRNKSLNYFYILNFHISLPSLPRFKNKSFNFIFWIFKSRYRHYHVSKMKVLNKLVKFYNCTFVSITFLKHELFIFKCHHHPSRFKNIFKVWKFYLSYIKFQKSHVLCVWEVYIFYFRNAPLSEL